MIFSSIAAVVLIISAVIVVNILNLIRIPVMYVLIWALSPLSLIYPPCFVYIIMNELKLLQHYPSSDELDGETMLIPDISILYLESIPSVILVSI